MLPVEDAVFCKLIEHTEPYSVTQCLVYAIFIFLVTYLPEMYNIAAVHVHVHIHELLATDISALRCITIKSIGMKVQ